MKLLQSILVALPLKLQHALRRIRYRWEIGQGTFISPEPEFQLLDQMNISGRIAIDIGANVGHYTLQLARAVGPRGHVIAYEPIPSTFGMLTSNVAWAGFTNCSLINAACSSVSGLVRMSIPKDAESGQLNFYQAHMDPDAGTIQILRMRGSDIVEPRQVAIVKVDAEGHDFEVLRGMRRILQDGSPVLIVESDNSAVRSLLEDLDYLGAHIPGSPNSIFAKAERWDELMHALAEKLEKPPVRPTAL